MSVEKERYSDADLEEFRELIVKKLDKAKKELELLQEMYNDRNENATDDTSPTFKLMEDGAEVSTREDIGQLALRQKKFIENLENALLRIQNKTYGACRVTGKLIPKERLRAVPHATLSIEAKMNQR
jgi:RNA polymerase-binding transcription factor DksA